LLLFVVVVVVDDDDDDDDDGGGDDKVCTATTLDCSLCHNLFYWLPFCEAAFCSMNHSALKLEPK
jgi:hypothetical protein